MSEKALLVLPMVLLIIAREIDLSVASILALTSVVLGVLVQAGVPLAVAIPLVLARRGRGRRFQRRPGHRLGLPSLVVTLGTLAMFRGIGYIILGTGSVNQFPDAFTNFGIYNVGGTPMPWTIVPFLRARAGLRDRPAEHADRPAHLCDRRQPRHGALFGRPHAADPLRLFVVSGIVCAIAGIVFTARLANARANNAVGFELDVITIALLGGISVFGGRGRLTGVLWALVLVATIRNVLGLNQIGGDAQGTVIGLLLIVSLLASNSARAALRAAAARPLLSSIPAIDRGWSPLGRRRFDPTCQASEETTEE